MSRKVVITGIGATTPIGSDAASTWQAALAGTSGIHALDNDWGEKYSLPVTIAGKVPAGTVEEKLTRVEAKRLDPSSQFALISAREAWADAGTPDVDPDRLAVSWASGIGGVWTLLDAWDTLRERGPRRVMPLTVPMLMPNGPAAAVGMELKARASVQTMVSACASSTESLGHALDILRSGRADVVVAGGSEAAIHPLPLAAFASMQALSKRNDDPEHASRPYDVDRDGFVMAEGAGALVLEFEDHAKARGATIYAELAGSGVSNDSYHITAGDPDGTGAARALRLALDDADASPADVRHINAHATSTPVGDIPESVALNKILGAAIDDAAVSATKSMTGHLLGGAGAVEAILTVLALKERMAPPTINTQNVDPAVNLDVVLNDPRKLPDGDLLAVSTSFGFGGHNAVVVARSV
ncbi:beta-ketoacyl-[acyl-carrier-protein] synthase family protein [Saxibacter everestensis]|uniref:3-oxoacyl-[acyl-carrier-protein] synthase 2 n=1 Tax=Saxibacter everestensis TaxID=2909229 RepID=A0ABY8QWR8_9MICO|nr:beta-ketoacyl-[acyl-carrier-protein] synthase family protein [Brevibacteriaceae bacterium ZFBP1038]